MFNTINEFKRKTEINFNSYKIKFASLNILEGLLNLVNKRPHLQVDFHKMNGYALMQRIYTSIANLNKFQEVSASVLSNSNLKTNLSNNTYCYYATIQIELLSILLNACFKKPVVCLNNYSKEKIKICSFNLQRRTSSSSTKNKENNSGLILDENNIYLINGELLSHVIEWTLWLTLSKNVHPWKYIFEVIFTNFFNK